ncbi:VanW family protein [Neomoorella thermoacetica]|uniref:VanW family protein n=1 Tax=Neomoorella thermoacetica TaxID=1525 RepID=UPI0008FA82C8|nr:VanW family protein [Moorella thermoacetica]OIQ11715.1 vancomycin B-type resistance protein VanW [Moorella thermoacetica]
MARWKLGVLLFFLLGLALLALARFYFSGRILPGVAVAGRPVGGMDLERARKVITELAAEVENRQVSLRLGEQVLASTPGALGLEVDVEATLARAYALGRQGPLVKRLVLLSARKRRVEPVTHLDQQRLQAGLERLGGAWRREPADARIEIGAGGQPRLVPAVTGWQVDAAILKSRLEEATTGQTIDIPLNRLEPRLTTAELAARRITRQVASFTTLFDPAEADRTHNIRLAAGTLDGLWLPPGGEFSFNRTVGPRTPDRGYRDALVVEEGNFVPGTGGGVCQVSSTLYNVALLAGLTITERQPHGLPITYVPPGRDATVAYGLIDLKFRNDTPYWYLLKTGVEAGKLTMAFYAADEAPRAEVTSQVLETIPPLEEIEWEPDWPPGRVELKREGKPGFRTQVIRIIYQDDKKGQPEVVSRDLYPPQPRIIRKGGQGGR